MSDDLVDALQAVERAVERVEQAVNGKIPSLWQVGLFALAFWFGWLLLPNLPGVIWHAKWRYALAYGVSSNQVHKDKRPHDCNFLASPMGEKYCDYEISVSTIRWSTSTAGQPIVSYDEGKTWSLFTPDAGTKVAQSNTVQDVYVSWRKKED